MGDQKGVARRWGTCAETYGDAEKMHDGAMYLRLCMELGEAALEVVVGCSAGLTSVVGRAGEKMIVAFLYGGA